MNEERVAIERSKHTQQGLVCRHDGEVWPCIVAELIADRDGESIGIKDPLPLLSETYYGAVTNQEFKAGDRAYWHVSESLIVSLSQDMLGTFYEIEIMDDLETDTSVIVDPRTWCVYGSFRHALALDSPSPE